MTSNIKGIIRTLEERLWKAQLAGDSSALDELISDNLLFTGLSGALETKAADLEQHRSGALKITKLELLEFQVREIPSGAITNVKMDGAAEINGKLVTAVLRYTRVWVQENGRWQIAGGHLSAVQSQK